MRTLTAQPYNSGEMHSLGRAEHMLIRQVKFPDTLDKRDYHTGQDHDRLRANAYGRFQEIVLRHTGSGDAAIGSWARDPKTTQKALLAFCVEVLTANPEVKWTGCRIMGTINRANGNTVFTIEVFAKHPDSTTQVYSDEDAPNVHQPRKPYIGLPSGSPFGRDWL